MFEKEKLTFISKGIQCSAWLYRPRKIKNPPVVVMAHGFGAQKVFRLPAFAERFVKEGMAVFLFDYRCFGESEGTPRNLINPFRHLNDWEAALSYVKTIDNINSDKIALWGSSFSGGHVIVTASRHPEVSAVISQVPHIDSFTTPLMTGIRYVIECYFFGIIDLFKKITFQKPFYVPIISKPDSFGCMNRADSFDGYMSIVPDEVEFENRCPARVALSTGFYRPITKASKVKCPTLIFHAEEDTLIYHKSLKKAVNKMAKGSLIQMPIKHFDIYNGKPFEEAVTKQVTFLKENLN